MRELYIYDFLCLGMDGYLGFCEEKKRYQNAFMFRPFCLKEPGVVCNVTIIWLLVTVMFVR
jgi:hypothetical protein